MPKNRRRNTQRGAKSISIRTKNKIGGRKSGKGVAHLSTEELNRKFETCRPRDRFKFVREAHKRIVLKQAIPT